MTSAQHWASPSALWGSAHMRTNTLERALKRAVFFFFFVASASHFLQPLDAEPLAVFQCCLRTTDEEYVFDAVMAGKSTRDALIAAA